MELFSPAATVLALSFVIGYHSSLTTGDAAIEMPLNNTVNIVQRAEAFQKRDATKPQLCGRIKAVISPLSRSNNIFKDDGDDLYDDVNDDEHLDRIVGGTYAVYGEFPWQAAIIFQDSYICFGAIISEFWVISASHCVRGLQSSSIKISVGDHFMWYKDTYEARYAVNNIIHHEQFDKSTFKYDIALIKIKATIDGRGIRFNDYVQPICLPYSYEIPPPGVVVTATGWGRSGADGTASTILRKAKLVIIHKPICQLDFPNIVNTETFCVFSWNRDNELCSSDGGAPVALFNEGFNVLVGVNSFSSSCGVPILSAGISNIPLHRYWIDSIIRLHSNGSEGVLPTRGYVVGG